MSQRPEPPRLGQALLSVGLLKKDVRQAASRGTVVEGATWDARSGARVRQRKTALVTIPSNQPRIAEKMTIQTSDTVDEPTTQLNLT